MLNSVKQSIKLDTVHEARGVAGHMPNFMQPTGSLRCSYSKGQHIEIVLGIEATLEAKSSSETRLLLVQGIGRIVLISMWTCLNLAVGTTT